MEINHLIQVLKHGYNYTRTNEDGSTDNVLVAPNKHMLRAAEVITQLDASLRQCVRLNIKLQQRYDNLEAQIQHTTPVLTDGDTTSDSNNRSD